MQEKQAASELREGTDFYRENGFIVFTREFHLKRGECCGSRCRHCPYDPRWHKGNTVAAAEHPAENFNQQPPSMPGL
ncbi:MAG: DUF5522 domain-containing protein [Blastocatellia bacterium]